MQKSKKVDGGKTVKIDAELGERYRDVKIHGDFFLDPEDKFDELNELVEGLNGDFDRAEVVERIEGLDVELIGFSADDLVDVLEKLRGGKK